MIFSHNCHGVTKIKFGCHILGAMSYVHLI